jgi:DNA mismatch endonuclease (patch repair protein)
MLGSMGLGAPPEPSSDIASKRMRATGQRDTRPERLLRANLHQLGLRYRVDRAPVAGLRRRADVVFSRQRVAVFVDGCFWHGCPEHMTWPAANREWWRAKIEATRRRDRDTETRLRDAGWSVLRYWEHDDPEQAAREIARVVEARRT